MFVLGKRLYYIHKIGLFMIKYIMNTVEIYNKKATEFIERYDKADMSYLHKVLLKYIPKKSSILDIGFGSGRDLQFLQDSGYDIWGIDPSVKFVANAKSKFPNIENQFFEASVPFEKSILVLNKEFDAVITIAMWMHLHHQQYEAVVESIVSVLKSSSSVVISYSEGNRANDERYFEDVDLEYITKLFQNKGFSLVETITHSDGLNRDSLTWITVVFKHDR